MRKLSAADDPHKANFQVDERIGIGAAVAGSDFGQPEAPEPGRSKQ